jgi:hypothetical protein
MTRSLLAILILSACVNHAGDYPSDARAPDAMIPMQDAQPGAQQGCNTMGNLPTARTTNVDDSDPLPSGLLGEIQDSIVGKKFRTSAIPLGGGAWCLASGTATYADNRWTATAAAVFVYELKLFTGTRILGLTFAYDRNGSGTIGLKLRKRSIIFDTAAADIAALSVVAGSGWLNAELSSSTPGSLLPYLTEGAVPPDAPADVLTVWAEVSLSTAGQKFGGAIEVIDRL